MNRSPNTRSRWTVDPSLDLVKKRSPSSINLAVALSHQQKASANQDTATGANVTALQREVQSHTSCSFPRAHSRCMKMKPPSAEQSQTPSKLGKAEPGIQLQHQKHLAIVNKKPKWFRSICLPGAMRRIRRSISSFMKYLVCPKPCYLENTSSYATIEVSKAR